MPRLGLKRIFQGISFAWGGKEKWRVEMVSFEMDG
jgi:hypothetical protein